MVADPTEPERRTIYDGSEWEKEVDPRGNWNPWWVCIKSQTSARSEVAKHFHVVGGRSNDPGGFAREYEDEDCNG